MNKEEQFQIQAEQQLISKDFDQVLNYIGMGKYQYRIYLAMALLGMCEGAQLIIYTITIPVLRNDLIFSSVLEDLQASLMFVSYLLGSVFSGYFGDSYGRKIPCLIMCFLVVVSQLLQTMAPNAAILVVIRTLAVLFVGFFAPLATTILAEITPSQNRGRNMSILAISLLCGQLYGISLAFITLNKDLESGNWRACIGLSAIPSIMSLILQVLFLDESPRFELLFGDKDKAIDNMGIDIINIEKMCLANKGLTLNQLQEDNRNNLIQWANQQNKNENTKFFDFFKILKDLISPQLRLQTILIWFNWFCYTFVYYGIVIYFTDNLKKLTEKNNEIFDLNYCAISIFCELIGLLLAAFIIDYNFFGRKNSMIIFYFISSITTFITYFLPNQFIYMGTVCKVFLGLIVIFCFQFTSEIYPTKLRTTGIGIANGIGRCGGILMPWIVSLLQQEYVLNPYILFSVICLMASFSSYCIPFDTTGKHLIDIQ